MTISVYAGPTGEPLTVAEVMAHCRIDASNQEPAPGLITAALPVTPVAGNVDNGAHRYLATFVTADGETQAGSVSAAVTVADKTVNGKVSLTAIPIGGALVTARKLYRTAAGGSVYLLLATISDNSTTTYTDNIADSSLGAQAPTTNTTSDPYLSMLISSARSAAEQALRRPLLTQTLDLHLDEFPRWPNPRFDRRPILLPPAQSVTSITYVDTAGVTQTLDPSQYTVDLYSNPSRIAPIYGVFWPYTIHQENAVTVRFVAGYGAAADVPQCIKHWMLMRIATLWRNRADIEINTRITLIQLPTDFVDGLLDPERVTARI